MTHPIPLDYTLTYHIFNRGNNREVLFKEKRNYQYFIKLYRKYILPIADTYAYCLMSNHFHFAVRVKSKDRLIRVLRKNNPRKSIKPGQIFGNLFNAYAKAVNKVYGRTGSLFENTFHRKIVTTNKHLMRLILYIHYNPQKHCFVDDFRCWPYSSYKRLISSDPTNLARAQVLELFGGKEGLIQQHTEYQIPDGLDY
jgi:REP element-mobilizing transposase RayT